jgi:hypothetical protein
MTQNTQNRNGKMLLANWFEIPEKDYIWYKLQGYEIEADEEAVIWWLNNKRHREDGPAFIGADGTQAWWLNDKRHRTDGPAIIRPNGVLSWCLNNKLHREDGPAVIGNGYQAWYLNDKEYTEQEWKIKVRRYVTL